MKKISFLLVLFLCLRPATAQVADVQRPLVLSHAVLPTPSKEPLLDPTSSIPSSIASSIRAWVLTTDQEAIQQWTSAGANHCLRGSFYFYGIDYLKRYADLGLAPGACDSAIRQFVTYGFNQGRIGAFDSYPIVFDFNYYVDVANNPDINQLYSSGAWDQVDVEIDWLQNEIAVRRVASAFFSIGDYQARYPDVSGLRPEQALFQYVTKGQADRRLGKFLWADPSEWSAVVAATQNPVVTAAPNDLVRSFTAANGKPTTVIAKSPKWYISPSAPYPSSVHICDVPPPNANNDWNNLTTFLTPQGVKAGCDVVRLARPTALTIWSCLSISRPSLIMC